MDAERAHDVTLRVADLAQSYAPSFLASLYEYEDERLKQRLWGKTFPNPVGLAAGADKNAQAVPFWESIGFGFVEAGSVTARPSDGNPQPRAFRLPDDEALVNRMGLNNDGAAAVAKHLEAVRRVKERPIGINIAKTHSPDIMGEAALEDFRESFHLLAPHAAYVALNISCPNTAEGKTFESPDALDELLTVIGRERKSPERRVPILLKLSPPESDRLVFDSALEDMISVALHHEVDGFIASNTMPSRSGLETDGRTLDRIGDGGLSGRPLHGRATQLVRYLYQATEGTVPIIGVGGVRDADTAIAMIQAGASLVQIYTGLVYEGPALVKRIKEGLVRRVKQDGLTSVADLVGQTARPAHA